MLCTALILTDSDSVLCSILYQVFDCVWQQANGQAEMNPTAGGVEAACGEPLKLGEMVTTSACTTSAYGDASFFIRYPPYAVYTVCVLLQTSMLNAYIRALTLHTSCRFTHSSETLLFCLLLFSSSCHSRHQPIEQDWELHPEFLKQYDAKAACGWSSDPTPSGIPRQCGSN